MGYTADEKVDIFSIYVKNNKNKQAARREYRLIYPDRQTPSANTFLYNYRRVINDKMFERKKRTIVGNDEDLNTLLYFEGKN